MSQSGHSQLVPNVIASALAFAVAVGIGFVMPRVIYESVGPVPLGLWDLGWSFLVYVSFSGIGFGPAIAHYVADHMSRARIDEVSEVCVTGFWLQLLFAAGLATAFVVGIGYVSDSMEVLETQSTVSLNQIGTFLGLAIGFVVLGDFAHGVLLGTHKARVTEAINIVHDLALAVTMVVVLLNDYGIVGLAVATALLRFVSECARFWYAASNCMGFTILPHGFRVATAVRLVRFGIKTSAAVFQEILVYQVARLVLFFNAGPLAFAAFSRYATLARQISRMVDRLSISVPALTSGLVAEGDEPRVRALYVNALQASMMVTLPALSVFCVFGDAIIDLWMGSEFVITDVSWVFAGGVLMHASYAICHRTLSGLNAHGRIALFCLFISGLVLLLALLFTSPQTPYAAAWLIMGTMLVSVHMPYIVFSSRKLSMSLAEFIVSAYGKPLLVNGLFLGALLISANEHSSGHPIVSMVVAGISIAGLVASYWYFVMSADGKRFIRQLRYSRLNAREASG